MYGTRPYRVFGEGETRVLIDGYVENKTNWTPSDYRFVQKGSTVYAYIMAPAENRVAVIHSVQEKVSKVRLLGYGEVEYTQEYGILLVKLPQELPTCYTNCLAIEVN